MYRKEEILSSEGLKLAKELIRQHHHKIISTTSSKLVKVVEVYRSIELESFRFDDQVYVLARVYTTPGEMGGHSRCVLLTHTGEFVTHEVDSVLPRPYDRAIEFLKKQKEVQSFNMANIKPSDFNLSGQLIGSFIRVGRLESALTRFIAYCFRNGNQWAPVSLDDLNLNNERQLFEKLVNRKILAYENGKYSMLDSTIYSLREYIVKS